MKDWLVSHNELLIVLHVAHQDGVDGSQQTSETLAVKCNNLESCCGDDVCCSWLIFEQGSLSKVVTLLVLMHLDGRLAWLKSLGGLGLARHDHEEAVTLCTLSDHILALFEPFLADGISQFRSLIRLHVLQNADLDEKFLILVSLLLGRVLHNVIEGASVERPQLRRLRSSNVRSSGSVVQQGKLSKRLSRHVVF